MQALRRRRLPVAGKVLADELGVSLRSIYRDIDTLKSLGAAIDGEAGLGFQLRADYWLPPLMFNGEEIEALVLGLRMLIYGQDPDMARIAEDVRSKVASVLPAEGREEMEAVGLFAVPPLRNEEVGNRLVALRGAIREQNEIDISYTDNDGAETNRVVWPLAIGYIGPRQMLLAWCTLRTGFRRFWVDKIGHTRVLEKRYPKARRTLVHEWRQSEQMADLS